MESGKGTLLAVLAHPDDESFGVGGTLALYARQGVAVYLVCATRGEAGTVGEEYLQGYDSIADRRVAELQCAAEKLGLAGVHFLGYRDSGMPGSTDNHHRQALVAAPLDEVTAKIVAQIRRLTPQVVVTFDPIGGYRHPDHIAIHRATLQAFHQAGDPSYHDGLPSYQPQKLYYQTIPKTFLRIVVWGMKLFGRDPRRYGRNRDIDLASLVRGGNFPVHARIDYRPVAEIKEAAAQCHISQIPSGPPRNRLMRWMQMIAGEREFFMRAYPPPAAGLRESDLFDGVALSTAQPDTSALVGAASSG
jgi:LmbE family N-acetylglucosaminyl deacetylase